MADEDTVPLRHPARASSNHQWEALKRYDAQRRRSLVAEPTTIIHSDDSDDESPRNNYKATTAEYYRDVGKTHNGISRRQESASDYLPPMPNELQLPNPPALTPAIQPPASYVPASSQDSDLARKAATEASIPGAFLDARDAHPTTRRAQTRQQFFSQMESTVDDSNINNGNLELIREKTPSILRGDKAVLVERELQRLRERKSQDVKRKWRVHAGASSLPLLILSVIVLGESAEAYLSLSPSDWVLSDAKKGTNSSPDPLLRSIALLEVVGYAIACFGILLSWIYLRATRRRTFGRRLIWFVAGTTTFIDVMLSLANLAIIANWHNIYSKNPNDPLAPTRDVGRRCKGDWSMDITWSAAKSSAVAKPGSAQGDCPLDPQRTTWAYLVASGVRLVLFTIFCALWLYCLGRYSAALCREHSRNETLEESPEMLKLLEQHEDMDFAPLANNADAHEANSSDEQVPRIARFTWQRDASAMNGIRDGSNLHVYGNLGRSHQRDVSAGAWSTTIIERIRAAVGDSPKTVYKDISIIEEGESENEEDESIVGNRNRRDRFQQRRSRSQSSGWISRAASKVWPAQATPDRPYGRTDSQQPDNSLDRISSQERRRAEGRHAAVRNIYSRDCTYSSPTIAYSSEKSALRERCEARRNNAKQSAVGAMFGAQASKAPSEENQSTAGRGQAIEVLQAMPNIEAKAYTHDWEGEVDDNENGFWRDELSPEADIKRSHIRQGGSAAPAKSQPVYVRTLGRLIRRMSLIESVGSEGSSNQNRSANRSGNRSASIGGVC